MQLADGSCSHYTLYLLFSESEDFEKVNIDEAVSVCLSIIASDSSPETVEVITVIKLGTALTASDMKMDQVLII